MKNLLLIALVAAASLAFDSGEIYKGQDVADAAINNSKDSRHKPESTRKDARYSKDFCFVQPA